MLLVRIARAPKGRFIPEGIYRTVIGETELLVRVYVRARLKMSRRLTGSGFGTAFHPASRIVTVYAGILTDRLTCGASVRWSGTAK